MACCARCNALFLSLTRSVSREIVLCATAVTCATADSSPCVCTPPPPRAEELATCFSRRAITASLSCSACAHVASACFNSLVAEAADASASPARIFRPRIASICESNTLCVSGLAPSGVTPIAAAAPTAASASASGFRRGAGGGGRADDMVSEVFDTTRPSQTPASTPLSEWNDSLSRDCASTLATASSASRRAARSARADSSLARSLVNLSFAACVSSATHRASRSLATV
mmetsp:Transcript_1126/g.4277  ORF Transcript_1126/g.4277 Transcript_1126/m.4277 type:complete len:231 (-) Transcript_1126:4719-5411(-)